MVKIFRGKRVLVVEDDPISLRFINLLLKKYGFITISASNGNIALELFKNNEVDVVLLDIQVPGLNGFELTKEIKKINSKVPVIVQSASDIHDFKERCSCAGCDDYISKPIEREELLLKLKNVLR